MIVGVPRETYPGERRVAMTPGVVPTLTKAGLEVLIEQGAGAAAGFPDQTYKEQGAALVPSRDEVFARAQVVLQVRGLGANPDRGRDDLALLHPEQILVGLVNPLGEPAAMQELAGRGVTVFALELLPRISRAQPMDALTSMATIAGYKAAILAADTLPRMFPMMMTAAGTVTPAKVFVVGVGVAGLQAIATCKRLGAVVQAYDIRPEVKEQVESVGGKFVELPLEPGAESEGGYARAMDESFYQRQREMMTQVVSQNDVVITTAAVPGRRAPVLVTGEMVRQMRPGSVVVDVAAEQGGNCDLTRPGETVVEHGITIVGPANLPSTIPYHASQMYARNLSAFLLNIIKDGDLVLDMDDVITRDSLVVRNGELVNLQVREQLASASGERRG